MADIVDPYEKGIVDPYEAALDEPAAKKSSPGTRAALKDIFASQGRVPYGMSDIAAENFTFGLTNQVNAGLGAAVTGVKNVASGKKPAYTAKEYYDAYRIYDNARRKAYSAKNPVGAFAASVFGGVAAPGNFGKFIVGKTAPALAAAGKKVPLGVRVAQGLRTSGVAGAQGALQGAAQANPGEEVDEAVRTGATAAVLAPVVGGALAAGVKAAPFVSRTGRRMAAPVTKPLINTTKPGSTTRELLEKYIAPPTADAETLRKIANILQKQELEPSAVQAALNEWKKAGGVTPAMIDILRDAGASQPVLTFLNESNITAPVRAAAEAQAAKVVGGVQERALTATEALKTGDPRTPSAIAADLQARTGAVDEGLAAQQAAIEAGRVAAQKTAPAAPVAPEEGAAAFANDLNAKYDVSYKAQRDAYDAAESAAPEEAFVVDSEVRPFFAKLENEFKGYDPDLPALKPIRKYLAEKKSKIAPGNAEDWPEGEVMELATPLTVQDMQFIKQMMNDFSDTATSNSAKKVAGDIKRVVEAEETRLLDNNLVSGNPEVIGLWKDASSAYRQFKTDFGSGLAEKLTKRGPTGEPVVEPFRAAEVIFGAKGTKPVNTLFSDLTDALRIASPEATEALKGELYLRLADNPKELARLLNSTGGRALLPQELAELNIGAQAENVAADEAAALAAKEAEAAALAAKEPITAEQDALQLGADWLTKDRDAFAAATDALPDELRAITASGAKGNLIGRVESPGPEDAISTRFMGARATENLGAALGPDQVQPWQAALTNIEKNAQNANEIAAAVSGSPVSTSLLGENIRAGDVVYPKVGATYGVLNMLRRMNHLRPEEQLALLQRLGDPAEGGLEAFKAALMRKYPTKSVAATPALARGFAAPGGDDEALDRLREEYGLDQ